MKLIDIIIQNELDICEVIARTLIIKDDYTYFSNNSNVDIYCSIGISDIKKLQDVNKGSTFYIDNLGEYGEYLHFNGIKGNTGQFTGTLDYGYGNKDSEVIKIDNAFYFIS